MFEPHNVKAEGQRRLSVSSALLGAERIEMENIYAYTEPGSSLPAFVSLNLVDGKRILSVRSRGTDIPATIELEDEDLEDMAADILNHLHPYDGAE